MRLGGIPAQFRTTNAQVMVPRDVPRNIGMPWTGKMHDGRHHIGKQTVPMENHKYNSGGICLRTKHRLGFLDVVHHADHPQMQRISVV